LRQKSSDVYIVKICPPIFSTLFTRLPKPQILCFTMLHSRSDTLNVCLPLAASTPHVIHVPWTHLTQHSTLHLNQFSCFHSRQSLYLTICIKMRFMRKLKN